MNLSEMRVLVRRDLHDEDESNYRWSDDELDRHIAHAVKDFSEALPLEQRVVRVTTASSREIDISDLTDMVMAEAVEYPVSQFPRHFQRFSLWAGTLTLLGDEVPDGSNAYIYYGKLHTLSASASTIPSRYEDLVTVGAVGYAALEWAASAINRVNVGGSSSPGQFLRFGEEKISQFRTELRRLGKRQRLRVNQLYRPHYSPVSRATDAGP